MAGDVLPDVPSPNTFAEFLQLDAASVSAKVVLGLPVVALLLAVEQRPRGGLAYARCCFHLTPSGEASGGSGGGEAAERRQHDP